MVVESTSGPHHVFHMRLPRSHELGGEDKLNLNLILVGWSPMSCEKATWTAGLSTWLRLMAQEESLDPFVSILTAAAHQYQTWCSQV